MSFRLGEEEEAGGAAKRGSRLIAGEALGGNAMAGFGVFERLPDEDKTYETNPAAPPKRSRKAGLGISLSF